jgi:hypothetical protein
MDVAFMSRVKFKVTVVLAVYGEIIDPFIRETQDWKSNLLLCSFL